MDKKLKKVGVYLQKYNDLLGINLPCGDIFQSDGLFQHVLSHHPDDAEFFLKIPEIIASPDYIGTDPNDPNGVEFIKKVDPYLLVAIRLDQKAGYLYVASLYNQTEAKLLRRINSGRYKKLF